MLAYLLWHRPADGVERATYEHAGERFHRSLHHSPPAGFRGSAIMRLTECPWLSCAQDGTSAAAYEDWYLLDDFAALGVLNEAAVAHGHRSAHDEVARRFGTGAGGLYGLMEGHADLAYAPHAVWVSRPPGEPRGELAQLLADGIDPRARQPVAASARVRPSPRVLPARAGDPQGRRPHAPAERLARTGDRARAAVDELSQPVAAAAPRA
jgi:hypothetical protein